jgi:hypothetical protein
MSKRILLGQLGASGDCLFATTIARQIKKDFPGCHLTWGIGSTFRSVLDENPDVDAVWEIPISNHSETAAAWQRFESEARRRKEMGDFDEVFLTQISPGNLYNFDTTIRTSIFRGYPGRISVPISPVLRLNKSEIENVGRFAERHRLAAREHVILFECSPKSGQSLVSPKFALTVSRCLVNEFPNTCVILSSNMAVRTEHGRILDGSELSFRENAELTKYCTLLVGCSSGITWVSTSDWAKRLPMIQILKSDAFCFASVVCDHEYWGISTADVIEMADCSEERVVRCVREALVNGFQSAKVEFHESLEPSFGGYVAVQTGFLTDRQWKRAWQLLAANVRRHGFKRNFLVANKVLLTRGLTFSFKRVLGLFGPRA